MKNRVYSNHKAMFHLFLAALLFLATPVWAKDWHGLQDLTDVQLSEKISGFQKGLDQNPSDYEALKALGIAYHIKARKDAKEYAPRAVEFLSRAYKINKKDNETMCYLGSATTMMAKTAWNPISKMSYVNKGAGLMDKAVKRDPDNVSVRMTRALNSKSLPSFLNRGDIALEDFEHLAGLIEKNSGYLTSIKKKVYSNLAELYIKAGDQARAEKFRKLAESL
jgi:cytochrome c-type biogenesis protein CcmH/NrfG